MQQSKTMNSVSYFCFSLSQTEIWTRPQFCACRRYTYCLQGLTTSHLHFLFCGEELKPQPHHRHAPPHVSWKRYRFFWSLELFLVGIFVACFPDWKRRKTKEESLMVSAQLCNRTYYWQRWRHLHRIVRYLQSQTLFSGGVPAQHKQIFKSRVHKIQH